MLSQRPPSHDHSTGAAHSTVLFGLTLAFALALIAWWTFFLWSETEQLAVAGRHLANQQIDAAARALGASDADGLIALAHKRRTMFLSEGLAFAVILSVIGFLFLRSKRREAMLRADQDRFLAGATHELKTPLATLKLLLESLRAERLPADKRARYLESGLLEAERLDRGLTNLLTAAGLRATPRPAKFEPGDLAEDARSALQALRARAEAAGVELHADELPSVPLQRDATAIQLVLHNLLDNAVKYSPKGAHVALALATDGEDAVLTVNDQGRGMDADELAHAFTPFWRGKDHASGGTGLGLFLAQELVNRHGGTIAATSAGTGRGSSITVRLPRQAVKP